MIWLIIPLIILSSCKKDTNISPTGIDPTKYYNNEIFNKQNTKIYGRWKYLYATGGNSGDTVDPTYDYIEFVHFGIYARLIDNNLLDMGQVIIIEQDASVTLIDFKPDEEYNAPLLGEKSVSFIGEDTLLLSDTCADCYTHYFRRKQ